MSSELHQTATSSEGEMLSEVEENGMAHQIATLIAVGAPFAGLVVAIRARGKYTLGAKELLVMCGMHMIAAVGITVGFHRLLTHRSFEAKPWVRGALTAAGSLAVEGKPTSWVADHRKHHDFADSHGDPHSPHVEHGGIRGFIHAHLGWLFSEGYAPLDRYARDLRGDEVVMAIDRKFPLFVGLALAIPTALGAFLGGKRRRTEGAIKGFLWGGVIRIGLTHHVTWSVNSICHLFGKRPFKSGDRSTNNWVLALPTLGEAWHNGHHAFPTSARHGLENGQVDLSWLFILLLKRLGLVWNVKLPSEKDLEKKRTELPVAS